MSREVSRRERRRLEVHERIYEAGVALFMERGYDETKVAEICDRADVAYGTFFNHFPAKLDLLREVTGRMMLALTERVDELRKRPGTTAERLIALFEEVQDPLGGLGSESRSLLAEIINLSVQESAEEDDRRIHQAFRGLLQQGVDAGDVRTDVGVDELTEVVVGAYNTTMQSWVHLDDYPIAERLSAIGRFLAESIAAPTS